MKLIISYRADIKLVNNVKCNKMWHKIQNRSNRNFVRHKEIIIACSLIIKLV